MRRLVALTAVVVVAAAAAASASAGGVAGSGDCSLWQRVHNSPDCVVTGPFWGSR